MLTVTWEGPQKGLRPEWGKCCPFKWHPSASDPGQDGYVAHRLDWGVCELAACVMGTGVFDGWVSLLILVLGEEEEGETLGLKVGLKPLFLASLRIRVL